MKSLPFKLDTVWKWILVLGAALYSILLPRLDVGCYNDDAMYVVAAKSILQGRYTSLQLPTAPPLNYYMPGFPLLLAPFVGFLQPHWAYLKIVPLLLTLATGFLLWTFLADWLPMPLRVIVLVLYVFNPTVVQLSGSVMSEPFFLLLTLVALVMLQPVLSQTSNTRTWIWGGILGWASLVRPEGIVLTIAIACGLAWIRRWDILAKALPIAVGIWACWVGRNIYLTHSPTGYLDEWSAHPMGFSLQSAGPLNLLYGFRTMAHTFLRINVLSFPDPCNALSRTLDIATSLGACGLGMIGIRQLQHQDSLVRQAQGLAIGIFCAFYFSVHAVWQLIDLRFLLPLIPFALMALIAGGGQLWKKGGAGRWTCGAAALALVLCYGYQNALCVEQLPHPPLKYQVPKNSLRWMQAHLPAQSLIFTPLSPVVYIYTGRYAVVSARALHDREELRYRMTKLGVTHLFLRPFDRLAYPAGSGVSGFTLWDKSDLWAQSWPQGFQALYHNLDEQTDLYAVVQDPLYQRAYELYLAGRDDLEKSDSAAGSAELQHSIQLYPTVSALNAYAVSLLLTGKNLSTAEQKLLDALRIEPDHPLALLNLARVYRATGRSAQAQVALQKAAASVSASGEYENLLPVIQQEEQRG